VVNYFTLQTRQTRATGVGFLRVAIIEPAPAPMTTRDINPHGFVNPSYSLAFGDVSSYNEFYPHFRGGIELILDMFGIRNVCLVYQR
jgi:hypothetical protein